jgi:hypothetical protein
MPTYSTPEPISVTVDLIFGDLHIIATDRTDTVVTVTPSDPAKDLSVQAAERVRVEHSARELDIRQPVSWAQKLSLTAPALGVITVTVELPTGSHVKGRTASGSVRTGGSLGTVELTSETGEFQLGEVTGGLRVKGNTGDIVVGRAHADVTVHTSIGNIRVGEVIRGNVELTTSVGAIEVGIREGSVAKLDAHTKLGRVRNALNGIDGPPSSTDSIHVRARTDLDDIVVRRA